MYQGMTPAEGVFWMLVAMALIWIAVDQARAWFARNFFN